MSAPCAPWDRCAAYGLTGEGQAGLSLDLMRAITLLDGLSQAKGMRGSIRTQMNRQAAGSLPLLLL